MSHLPNTPGSSKRLTRPATVYCKDLTLPLTALIDSGVEENFLDLNLARQAGFEIEPLNTPLVAHALDGRPLAKVLAKAHRTVPLTLILSGNQRETVRLRATFS